MAVEEEVVNYLEEVRKVDGALENLLSLIEGHGVSRTVLQQVVEREGDFVDDQY